MKQYFLFLFFAFSIFSHSFPENHLLLEPEPEQETPLLLVEKKIIEHVTEIERLHSQIVKFNSSMKQEIMIDQHVTPFEIEDGEQISVFKYTNLFFRKGKLHEVHIGSKKRYTNHEYRYENKNLIYVIEESDASNLYIETFDNRSLSTLRNFTPENKLKTLKMVENYLQNSIYKLEVLLHKYEKWKTRDENKKLSI